MQTEYRKDFFKWTKDQASLLRDHAFSNLDINNLIEEIETLGRSEASKLQSHLEILLIHMLKVQFQPEKQTYSWHLSIRNASFKSHKCLEKNPSLKPELKEMLAEAYFSARLEAAKQTGLSEISFPEECPYAIQYIFSNLEPKYW